MHHAGHAERRTWTRARVAALAGAGAVLVAAASATAAVAPTAATLPIDRSLVTDTYALIGGTINPGGTNTGYRFDWGPTAAYGKSTPGTAAGNGTADVPVDVSLNTLEPNTTYHYRLVAYPIGSGDPGQQVSGGDQTFKTAPSPTLKFPAGRIKVNANGNALVRLSAVGPVDTTQDGTLTLKAVIKGARRTIGSVQYQLDAGKSKTLSVPVSAVGRRALHARHRLAVRASAKSGGIRRPFVHQLTLVG